jgi:hypothetical protein
MIGGSVELGAADVKRSESGSSFLGVAAGGRVPQGRYGNMLLFVEPTGYIYPGVLKLFEHTRSNASMLGGRS